jgi:hypothetical protein
MRRETSRVSFRMCPFCVRPAGVNLDNVTVDDEPRDLKFARCQRLDAGSVGLAGL